MVVRLSLALTLVAGCTAFAQLPGAGAPAGMSAALGKLFGNITAFSAKADVQVVDAAQSEVARMPMDFSLLDQKIRIVIDMTQVKSKDMPPGGVAMMRQMGMTNVISIIRPDKNLVHVVYPGQSMVMNMPLPKESAAAKNAEVKKTVLGKETVDGHPCVKHKNIIPGDNGQSTEVYTWNASDLKEFPVKIQTTEKGNTAVMRFSQVKFDKPDAKQFDPPAGYQQMDAPMGLK